MEYERLENEIKSLIELHAEGIYWDFKKQWHEKNSDLLHDIKIGRASCRERV